MLEADLHSFQLKCQMQEQGLVLQTSHLEEQGLGKPMQEQQQVQHLSHQEQELTFLTFHWRTEQERDLHNHR